MARQRTFDITHTFSAKREDVFSAWLHPELLSRWISPEGFSVTETNIEPNEGGTWEFVMVEDSSGKRYPNKSQLLELVPNDLLVIRDSWKAMGVDAEDTIMTVKFEDVAEGTKVTLHGEPMPDNEFTDGAPEGWSQSFRNLEKLLAS